MALALGLVIASFFIFVQLIRPAYNEAQDLRSQVISRETFVGTQQAAITQVKQLIETYRNDTGVQDAVSQALPSDPSFGTALYQLNGIAGLSGVQLQSFSVSAPQLASVRDTTRTTTSTPALVAPVGTVTFQLKALARYEDTKSLLRAIESNVRLMDVQSVSIQPAGGKLGQDLYTIEVTVAAYYQIN